MIHTDKVTEILSSKRVDKRSDFITLLTNCNYDLCFYVMKGKHASKQMQTIKRTYRSEGCYGDVPRNHDLD